MIRATSTLIAVCLSAWLLVPQASAEDWKAGAAKVNITPTSPMWMSGYAGRTKPAEGTVLDLWAKALVLEDAGGRRVALVTLDLVGLGRDVAVPVCEELQQKYGLARQQVALCTSHTHCGPIVGQNLMAMYMLPEAEQQRVREYAVQLHANIVAVVGQAIERLAPSSLSWSQGRTTLAVNRRNNREAEVPQVRAEGRLVGPVDHDVPVLCVRDPERRVRAVVFGYACHATVMDFLQWSGDYPGFAQQALEQAHPEAVALFFAGCGADQNPLPRRKPELAQEYGQRLAAAVQDALTGVMKPLESKLDVAFTELPLPLATLPTRAELETQAASQNIYEVQRAKTLLAQIDAGTPLSQTYPYPVQTWRLGSDVIWVTLGGEVVVDYALRIKRELGPSAWVAGYTNDVMAYIPSLRVLKEGGYEGGGAMLYYGLPTVWAAEVEEVILKTVHEQAAAVGR